MALIFRSKASLRISGDALDPDDITRRLGAGPTRSHRKGDAMRPAGSPERVHLRPTGSWHLSASEAAPENINGQVAEVLGQLTTDLSVWTSIASEYRLDIFCGLFMGAANEGFSLSPKTMSALASRGIEIGFDVYAPDSD